MKTSLSLKLATLISVGALLAACNGEKEAPKEEALVLDDQASKVSYAIGVSAGQAMGRNLESLDGTSIVVDKEILVKAFGDGVLQTSQMEESVMNQVMTEFRENLNAAMQEKQKAEQAEQAKVAEENKAKGAAFLAENKEKEGVVTTESGLQYKVITEGTGESPTASDRVKVHYVGTLIDGTQFDSSIDRGEPATFGVTQVIAGWTEALQLMKEGSKWQLFIPSDLAYGETSRPTIPGNSVLIFDVELLEVIKPDQEEGEE